MKSITTPPVHINDLFILMNVSIIMQFSKLVSVTGDLYPTGHWCVKRSLCTQWGLGWFSKTWLEHRHKVGNTSPGGGGQYCTCVYLRVRRSPTYFRHTWPPCHRDEGGLRSLRRCLIWWHPHTAPVQILKTPLDIRVHPQAQEGSSNRR